MNLMLIGRAFCRLLTVGRLLHWKFCLFWLFLSNFRFLDCQGHVKSFPQKVRNKGGLWTGWFWPTPINSPHTLWKPPLVKDLCVTWLTCNSGVRFRNRYDYWLHWPIQPVQLWSQFLLVRIRISWKFIHHWMSVSNSWVLSLKIKFLLSIRVSRRRTRPSSHFYPAFRLLRHRKMSE